MCMVGKGPRETEVTSAKHGALGGARSLYPEITTSAETKNPMLNQLHHPVAPILFFNSLV